MDTLKKVTSYGLQFTMQSFLGLFVLSFHCTKIGYTAFDVATVRISSIVDQSYSSSIALMTFVSGFSQLSKCAIMSANGTRWVT